jgi:hypothetical protein
MTAAAFLKRRDSWLRAVVEDPNLSHSTVRVAVHIAMRMNGARQSGAWPSIKTISDSSAVSQRSVVHALDELSGLVDRKTLDWSGRRYLAIERKRNTGNRYHLNFWWE